MCIDEARVLGGAAELEMYTLPELHLVEVYGTLGSEVRVFTRAFMTRAAMLGGRVFHPRGAVC